MTEVLEKAVNGVCLMVKNAVLMIDNPFVMGVTD